MLKATSRALDSICKQTWPQDLGQLSIPQIWRKIHNYFETTDDSISLTCVNDDLVGFFNSVPQTRLLDAVHQLLDQWMLAHEKHFDNDRNLVTISVDLSARGDPVQPTFSGTMKRTAFQTRYLYVSDIFEIVQSSLDSHIFSALGCFWRQIRGAGICSQISPSLSNLAVTVIERSWSESFAEILRQPALPLFSVRYADNRFLICSAHHFDNDALKTFCDLDFYGPHVELETVDDDVLLGFDVNIFDRTVKFRQPDVRQIRDLVSAGSLRLKLSEPGPPNSKIYLSPGFGIGKPLPAERVQPSGCIPSAATVKSAVARQRS